MDCQPTVFHITHHKAGSQWVAEVLKQCALNRSVWPKSDLSFFYHKPIKPHKVYLSIYVPRQDFDTIIATYLLNRQYCKHVLRHLKVYLANWFHFRIWRNSYRTFVVIRDLRDTLISLYFSWKISHVFHLDWENRCRKMLNTVNKEQGLLYWIGDGEISPSERTMESPFLYSVRKMADSFDEAELCTLMSRIFEYIARIQVSWLHANVLFVKYEDLIADQYNVFEQIIDYCRIDVNRQRLHEIVHYNTFEAATGRRPGQEDLTAHQRKGVKGDWQNHFSDHVKTQFKKRFGDVLIKTGYESNLNW